MYIFMKKYNSPLFRKVTGKSEVMFLYKRHFGGQRESAYGVRRNKNFVGGTVSTGDIRERSFWSVSATHMCCSSNIRISKQLWPYNYGFRATEGEPLSHIKIIIPKELYFLMIFMVRSLKLKRECISRDSIFSFWKSSENRTLNFQNDSVSESRLFQVWVWE